MLLSVIITMKYKSDAEIICMKE